MIHYSHVAQKYLYLPKIFIVLDIPREIFFFQPDPTSWTSYSLKYLFIVQLYPVLLVYNDNKQLEHTWANLSHLVVLVFYDNLQHCRIGS